jgi:uncharacterized protein YeaO (DUF488 family)
MAARKPNRIQIKRAYDAPARGDGQRVLVDRIWPRGVARERLALDAWLKDAAPSDGLRQWFNHDPGRWREFVARYKEELKRPPANEALAELARCVQRGPVTLVYAARDEVHNNAVALRDLIVQRQARRGSASAHARRP